MQILPLFVILAPSWGILTSEDKRGADHHRQEDAADDRDPDQILLHIGIVARIIRRLNGARDGRTTLRAANWLAATRTA